MSDFFEISPDGIRTDGKWDENKQEYNLIRTQDVEPVIDNAKENANQLGLNRNGIKEGWWQYASLPAIVILQMRAKGIDVFNSDHQKRMFQEINAHYPWLKTTTGNEGEKQTQVFL